ncbi:MAG TPA: ROK family protein [Candidatus Melainabacteria bacterium]|nr:ROK family protein [Candidatus Melainabacteria bacterium]
MPKRNPKAAPKEKRTVDKKRGSAKASASARIRHKSESKSVRHITKSVTAEDLESRRVLAIDIGGTNVKLLLNGQTETRKFPSSKEMTPADFIEQVKAYTADWDYNCVSIGYPGLTGPNGPLSEPGNLGPGWVAFDFQAAFNMPVKLMNDAAMQALGSYEGGRMLFLGFGTGLGSTLICHSTVISLELGNIRWNDKATSGEMLGRKALKKLGRKKWRKIAWAFINSAIKSFNADYIVVGGGNAKLLGLLPPGVRRGHNQTAFRGGFRLFGVEDMPNTSHETLEHDKNWRLL